MFFGTEPVNVEGGRAVKAERTSKMGLVARLEPIGGPIWGLRQNETRWREDIFFLFLSVSLFLLTSPSFPSHLFPLPCFFSPPGT